MTRRKTIGATLATLSAVTLLATPGIAAPEQPSTQQASQTTVVKITSEQQTVKVPDIAWSAQDDISIQVTPPPAPTPPPPTPEPETEPANRSREREELTEEWVSVPAANGTVTSTALQYQGVPYVYGGSTPSGFDCSGFTSYVYGLHGISMPRTSWQQGSAFPQVNDPQAGDLMYWGGHVAIYLGDGMMIHSPYPGRSVEVVPVFGSPTYHRVF